MPKARVVCIGCEVFARQIYLYAALSERYCVDVVLLPRDLHNHPPMLRRMIQEQIDKASQYSSEPQQPQQQEPTVGHWQSPEADAPATTTKRGTRRRGGGRGCSASLGPYSAVLVGFGVCGGGTAGLVCRGVPVVVLNRDDCAAVLLGSSGARAAECRKCPGTWYCHRGDVERRALGSNLHDAAGLLGPSAAAVAMCGDSGNESFLKDEAERIVRSYTRLLYIRTSDDEDENGAEAVWARSQAETNGWTYEEAQGTDKLLRSLLCGGLEDACRCPDDFVVMTKVNEETELVQDDDRMVLRVKGAPEH